jgi:hypothetical protein
MTHQIIRSLLTVNCLENNAVAGERIVHFASVNGLLGTMGTPLCCSGGALLVHVELHTTTLKLEAPDSVTSTLP